MNNDYAFYVEDDIMAREHIAENHRHKKSTETKDENINNIYIIILNKS